MAKAKNPLAQANKARAKAARARQLEVQKGLTKLKRAGLFTGDAKTASKSSRGSRLTKQYADVISGKAKAVKADLNTEISYRAAGGKAAHGRVVVPVMKGERARFDKKTGTIVAVRKAYGNKTIRTVHFTKFFDPKKVPKPPKGKQFFYYAQFEKGSTQRFESLSDFQAYMNSYGNAQSKNPAVRDKFNLFWASHFSIEEVDDGEDPSDGDDE